MDPRIREADLQLPEIRSDVETAEDQAKRQTREPLAYRLGGPSYFLDLYAAEKGNTQARERLERHGRQMDDLARHASRRELQGAEYETRINPSTEVGHGGEFAPPLWLIQQFATARRPGQILQQLIPTFDLPKGVSSVSLPRVVTGNTVDVDVPLSPVDSSAVTTEAVSSPAVVFSGNSDWPIQALEQSPTGAHLDWAMFKDMSESSDFNIERQLVFGDGKGGEFYGLIELPGTNTIEYLSPSPSGVDMIPEIGKILAQVGVKRRRPPTALLMNTSRFYWLVTSEDNSNRPLEFANKGFVQLEVHLDDAIPNTFGASKEQDAIFACRPDDMIFMDTPPVTAVQTDVLSGTLEVRFQLHRTVAALVGRYPTGISKLIGTGMTVQEGFK
jgi:hypothetical protein